MTRKVRLPSKDHTDDVPISTSVFHSNLELSTSRAIRRCTRVVRRRRVNQQRFTVAGYADSRPLVPNNTLEGRVKNRRVEVVIEQGLGDARKDLEALRRSDRRELRQGTN